MILDTIPGAALLVAQSASSSLRVRWVPRVHERTKLVELEELIEHADAVRSLAECGACL
jgi:hypothetical protein